MVIATLKKPVCCNRQTLLFVTLIAFVFLGRYEWLHMKGASCPLSLFDWIDETCTGLFAALATTPIDALLGLLYLVVCVCAYIGLSALIGFLSGCVVGTLFSKG